MNRYSRLKSIVSFFFILIFTLFVGCQEDESQTLNEVTFSINSVNSTSANGRVSSINVSAVLVGIKDVQGNVIVNLEKLNLYSFGESYLSLPFKLPNGKYYLTEFLVLDENQNVVYVTPKEGSPMAELVNDPLDIEFEVSKDVTTVVSPEVIAVDQSVSPDEFGYSQFGFEVVDVLNLDISASTTDDIQDEEMIYSLEIIAKDAPLGEVQWSRQIPISGSYKIHIPSKYGHYTFRAIKEGYITHVQHFLVEELKSYDALPFEFIPESLEGFEVFESLGMKYYFPNDQHRYKLFGRVDVEEGFVIIQSRIDKNATTSGGLPVPPLSIVRESENSTPNFRLNLFDNLPFKDAMDFVPIPPNGKTLDDINIKSFLYVKYSTGQFVSHSRVWKGANN